jgi:peptidyl-prolyl cis-trans isomerase C
MIFLKEPLLHFLIIGACLFGVYAWLNPDAMQSDKRIVVDQGQVNSLTMRFQRVWQREPSKQELQGLIEDYVIEEIYYREALAMGIDKDDPIIRRRLRQKMETYTDNLATTLAPSEDELNQYLQQHPDKFKTQSRYSFQQVYINTDIPEDQLQAKLTSIQSALQSGESVDSGSSLLPASFTDTDGFVIDRTFGQGFAAQLDTLELNQWSPPLQSGLGMHFVMLSARQPGQLPALASIRDKVEREWRFDKAQEIDKVLRKKLLASYDVVVTADENRL